MPKQHCTNSGSGGGGIIFSSHNSVENAAAANDESSSSCSTSPGKEIWVQTGSPFFECRKLPEHHRTNKRFSFPFQLRVVKCYQKCCIPDGTRVEVRAGNEETFTPELKNYTTEMKNNTATFTDFRLVGKSGRGKKFMLSFIIFTEPPHVITYPDAIKITVDGPRDPRKQKQQRSQDFEHSPAKMPRSSNFDLHSSNHVVHPLAPQLTSRHFGLPLLAASLMRPHTSAAGSSSGGGGSVHLLGSQLSPPSGNPGALSFLPGDIFNHVLASAYRGLPIVRLPTFNGSAPINAFGGTVEQIEMLALQWQLPVAQIWSLIRNHHAASSNNPFIGLPNFLPNANISPAMAAAALEQLFANNNSNAGGRNNNNGCGAGSMARGVGCSNFVHHAGIAGAPTALRPPPSSIVGGRAHVPNHFHPLLANASGTSGRGSQACDYSVRNNKVRVAATSDADHSAAAIPVPAVKNSSGTVSSASFSNFSVHNLLKQEEPDDRQRDKDQEGDRPRHRPPCRSPPGDDKRGPYSQSY